MTPEELDAIERKARGCVERADWYAPADDVLALISRIRSLEATNREQSDRVRSVMASMARFAHSDLISCTECKGETPQVVTFEDNHGPTQILHLMPDRSAHTIYDRFAEA